jgi:DNA primase
MSLDAHELKARVDLSAVACQFTRLRRAGRQFVGLCPLHAESNPSFFVNPEKNVFKCFGCGAGGDVFVFVMRAMGCDFRRALEIVAEMSDRVARESSPRSGERFRTSEGAKPLSPAQRGALYSQSTQESRARILLALNTTNRRLSAIEAANRAASAALATACEPERGGESLLLEETK